LLLCVAVQAHDGNCKNASPSAATVTAREALQAKPTDLDARLKLADALIADSCFDDAIAALQEGEPIHGRNTELQSHLREARSMLSEQRYFDGLDKAEESAKASRNLLRCNRLADLQACDAALALNPNDATLMTAKADALVQAKRLPDALIAYRRAKELAPDNTALTQQIATVEAQRQALLNTCQSASGEAALQACRAVLLRGDVNEFAILKRQGILLQADNQLSPALDAYIAADRLKRGDRSIALAIVALSDSTGRNDALTLAERGTAMLTLGRAVEALAPLRQALALSPDLPEVKAQLVEAERAAKQASARVASASALRPATVLAAAENAAPARRYSNAALATRSR
jgi:tetratricopeptide (TPR) repeat protein